MKCRLLGLNKDEFTHQQIMTVLITDGDAKALFSEYGKDRELEISLSETKRKKRSLDANAYFWQMLNTLAGVIDGNPHEMYRAYIRDLGGNSETLQIRTAAIPSFERAWEQGHKGRFVEIVSYDDELSCISAYYGSSDYDTRTFSRLLDRLLDDCKEQGIETATPKEKERLMAEWEKRYGRLA